MNSEPDHLKDFLPTCDWKMLHARNDMMRMTRRFFHNRGFLEVETPLLSQDSVIDAWIDPFEIQRESRENSTNLPRLFLQTSPEFAMKRLLAAGGDSLFQICKAFRKSEMGDHHNPEFTMIEWYCLNEDHHEQMQFVETFVRDFLHEARSFQHREPDTKQNQPWPRIRYSQLIRETLGCQPQDLNEERCRNIAEQYSIDIPSTMQNACLEEWANLLFVQLVEPTLARIPAIFVFDYPASQSALAKLSDNDSEICSRFELYLDGMEICNGYHELTDAQELVRRQKIQSKLRAEADLKSLPQDNRLIKAMQSGLPDCAGVALGFDRLMMHAFNKKSISDVIPFPFDRA